MADIAVSARLADFVASLSYEHLPQEARITAKRALLDAMGVMIAASRLEPACGAFARVAAASGDGLCTLIGTRKKTSSQMAAFSNGALAHALDFEDTHEPSLMHPNAATVPAALAIAEERGAVSGERFLASLVAGSEVVCRLGLALTANPLTLGWYIPPILGAYGATASACNLLKLTPTQTLNAFGHCLYQATCTAEFLHSPQSGLRAVRDGFAARAGVVSALLAEQDLHSVDLPLEGKCGLFAQYAGGFWNPATVVEDLGRVWHSSQVSFKAWPSCRGTHPYVQAALRLRALHPHIVAAVTSIVVDVGTESMTRPLVEPLARKQRPRTAIDAKFSIPFCVATALVHGDVALEHFTDSALCDARVLAVSKLVRPVFVPVTDARKQSVQGSVRLETSGGILEQSVVDLYGSPANPLTDTDLQLKYRNCARSPVGMGTPCVVPKVDTIMNMDQLIDSRLLLTDPPPPIRSASSG